MAHFAMEQIHADNHFVMSEGFIFVENPCRKCQHCDKFSDIPGISRRKIEVPDKGILADTRGRVNVSGLIEQQGLWKIRPDAKIQLSGEKGFFGPGTLLLLSLTRETGSLKQAAQQMGISYSKALSLISRIEEQLGCKVLESRQGGSEGGSSVVTKKAQDLMKRYEAFEAECREYIKSAFEKHFT